MHLDSLTHFICFLAMIHTITDCGHPMGPYLSLWVEVGFSQFIHYMYLCMQNVTIHNNSQTSDMNMSVLSPHIESVIHWKHG